MAGQRRRKRSYYGKLPSPRLFHDSTVALNPEQPPPGWVKLFGFSKKVWSLVVMDLRKQEQQAWRLAHEALFHHFGMMISTPGAWRNLALSLAHRHERKLLVSGQCICFSALCEKYGVDPADYECADQTLALKLAERYVWPEIDPPSPKLADWGTRWSTEDLARLVWAILAVASVLEGSGKGGSARAIATAIQDQKGLAKIIPKGAAANVHAILASHGNRARGGRSMSRETWLRTVLIPAVTKPGKPTTPLKQQLYFAVLPLVHRAMGGQIEAVSGPRK